MLFNQNPLVPCRAGIPQHKARKLPRHPFPDSYGFFSFIKAFYKFAEIISDMPNKGVLRGGAWLCHATFHKRSMSAQD